MENKELEELVKNTKYQVIKLEEESQNSSKKRQVIDHLSLELDKLFSNAKKVVNETKDSEQAKSVFEKVKKESAILFDNTKKALQEFKEDERVQDVWSKINTKFDEIVTKISENDTIQNMGDKVNDFVQKESVQNGLQTAKEVTLDLADKAHTGIKNLLDKDKESKG